MHFALLGPLEVQANGGSRAPSAPMARRVLAVLMTHADRVVSIDLLIEELWGDRPPKLAKKTVQTYIFQIRRALCGGQQPCEGQQILETHPHGYRLPVRTGQLDLWQFQEYAREGYEALRRNDPGRAAETLRRGLGLWRGPALSGLEKGGVLTAQHAHLEDLRVRAVEQRIEAELRLGRHRALIGELHELTARYPLHEEFHAQLMTAAHRSGRRDEALAAYAALRKALVRELGLEPSERLRDLQRSVLSDYRAEPADHLRVDAGGDFTNRSAASYQLPAATFGFSCRSHEMAAIRRVVESAANSPVVSVVLLTGGLGTGKTEAALHAAHSLRHHFPEGQLHATLHTEEGVPRPPAEVLRGLLTAVGQAEHRLPDDTDGLSRMFRSWAAGRRFLVMLDDAAGTDQVLPLLPATGGSVVLITSRCRLTGLPGSVTPLPINPLTAEDGAELLTALVGRDRTAPEPDAVRRIVRCCDGLPIVIRSMADRISAWPNRSLAEFAERLDDEQHRLDELSGPAVDVAGDLLKAADRLPPEIRDVLSDFSRHAMAEINLQTLARQLGQPVFEVERLAESLMACHVLTARPSRDKDDGYVLSVAPLVRLALSRQLRPNHQQNHVLDTRIQHLPRQRA